MSLDPTFSTAISQIAYTAFTAFQMVLPNQTLNLLDASGYVAFNIDGTPTTFFGRDPIFGTLVGIGQVGSTMGNETSRTSIIIMPPTQEAISYLASPAVARSRVRCFEGAYDPQTGLVIGQPKEFWTGILDVAIQKTDNQSRTIEIDTVSNLSRFLMKDEGKRLNVSWQQRHFPGSTGLRHSVNATEVPIWGAAGIGAKGFGNSGLGGGMTGGTGPGGGGYIGGYDTQLF